MKVILLYICLSINIYAIEFEKTNGKEPEGNHCVSYVFAQFSHYNNLKEKYKNSKFWIKMLNSEKEIPNLENSLNIWEEITKIKPQVILEPNKPLKHKNIYNKKLLWIGIPHPDTLPKNINKIYIHACILEITPYKITLNHFGDDSEPFMKEHLTFEELIKRTIYIYKIESPPRNI